MKNNIIYLPTPAPVILKANGIARRGRFYRVLISEGLAKRKRSKPGYYSLTYSQCEN